jgi:hypothetical protein
MTRPVISWLRDQLEHEFDPPEGEKPRYRTKSLPKGELHGTFLVTTGVIQATRAAVSSFAHAGVYEGGHEGIAYWAGREMADCTVFMQALIPVADHSNGRVMVSELELSRVRRAASRDRLGLLAQIHSHPGPDARHSDGDDDLVLMPFENMLSIVLPHFGFLFETMADACVHQFQAGKWVLCSEKSVRDQMRVISEVADMRVAE